MESSLTTMVRAIRAFLDFCYLVRRNIIDEYGLREIRNALERFRHYREIFVITGVRPDGISLPRQHSIFHYPSHIENFASPGGVCTSMSSPNILWRSRNPTDGRISTTLCSKILLTNERNDKLAAARVDFMARGMLEGSCVEEAHHRYLLSRMYPASVCDLI